MKKLFVLVIMMAVVLSACASPASAPTAIPPTAVPPTVAPTASPTVVPTEAPTQDPGVAIDFVNNTNTSLEIFWVDFEGKEQSYGSVAPGQSFPMSTYPTHVWHLRDAQGSLVLEYQATEAAQQTATILPEMVATPVPLGERTTVDRPDDFQGMYQVHLLYVLPSDAKDRNRDLNGKINKSIKAANDWFYKQSDGSKIRFDTYQGELDITFVQLDLTSAEIYQASVTKYGGAYWIRDILEEKLAKMNVFKPGKMYLGLFEIAKHPSTCDDAAHPSDLMGRLAGFYPSAVVEAGWKCADQNGGGNFGAGSTYADIALIHETVHLLGYASSCGKNPTSSDNQSHTGDFNYDLMWAPGPKTPSNVYWDTNHMKLDPGNDDYFKHTIPNCPDLANSAFLDPLPANPETPPDWPADWKLP